MISGAIHSRAQYSIAAQQLRPTPGHMTPSLSLMYAEFCRMCGSTLSVAASVGAALLRHTTGEGMPERALPGLCCTRLRACSTRARTSTYVSDDQAGTKQCFEEEAAASHRPAVIRPLYYCTAVADASAPLALATGEPAHDQSVADTVAAPRARLSWLPPCALTEHGGGYCGAYGLDMLLVTGGYWLPGTTVATGTAAWPGRTATSGETLLCGGGGPAAGTFPG